jgi:hypothetical protein
MDEQFGAVCIGAALLTVIGIGYGIGQAFNQDEIIRARADVAQQQYEEQVACSLREGSEKCECLAALALDEEGTAKWRHAPRSKATQNCWDNLKGARRPKIPDDLKNLAKKALMKRLKGVQ